MNQKIAAPIISCPVLHIPIYFEVDQTILLDKVRKGRTEEKSNKTMYLLSKLQHCLQKNIWYKQHKF